MIRSSRRKIRRFVVAFSCLAFVAFAFSGCGGKNKGFSLARGQEKTLNSCLALLKKKKHEAAIQCLEAYKSRHQGSAGAAEADLAIADSYFAQKDYMVAAEAYNLFIETYTYHERLPYAYFRAGLSYFKQAPKTVDRDLTYLESAQKLLGAVVTYYGSSPYAAEAKTYYDQTRFKMAKHEYYVGRHYYKYKEYLAAIPRFETVVTEYPQLGLDDKSFYYLVRALKETNQGDVAMKYFELYKKHYPENMKAIKKMAALF